MTKTTIFTKSYNFARVAPSLNEAKLWIKWLPSLIIQKITTVWDIKPGCSNIPPILDKELVLLGKPHDYSRYSF